MTMIDNGFKTLFVRKLALASAFLTAFGCSGLYFDWGKSDWATWVGSIGTVGTLYITGRIATGQQRRQEARDLAIAITSAANFEVLIEDLTEDLENCLTYIKYFDGGDSMENLALARAHLSKATAWPPESTASLVGFRPALAAELARASALLRRVQGRVFHPTNSQTKTRASQELGITDEREQIEKLILDLSNALVDCRDAQTLII